MEGDGENDRLVGETDDLVVVVMSLEDDDIGGLKIGYKIDIAHQSTISALIMRLRVKSGLIT